MAKRRTPMHYIDLHLVNEPGVPPLRFPVPVINGKEHITLPLTLEHIRRSRKLHGQSTTTNCAVAICAKEHAHLFPHEKVYMITLQARTAHVITRVDKNGWPTQAVRYEHHCGIPQLFDKRGGPKKLEKMIMEKGGQLDLVLHPYKPNNWTKGERPTGPRERTGERNRSTGLNVGAKKRFMAGISGLPNPRTKAGRALAMLIGEEASQ